MRLFNWEARLSAYISSVAREGFAYGKHDCALFAAGGVRAITGEDPAALWLGRYTTELGGLRHLRRSGYRDHVAHAEDLFPELPATGIMPGDLAIIPGGIGALGIVQGEMIYVVREHGLGLIGCDAASKFLAVR